MNRTVDQLTANLPGLFTEEIMSATHAFTDTSTVLDLNRKFRDAKCLEAQGNLRVKASITVLSNFSTQYLVAALYSSMIFRGIHPTLYESSFDQWEFELANPESETYRRNSDYLLLLLSSTRLMLTCEDNLDKFVDKLKNLLLLYRAKCRGEIILALPESLSEGFDQTSIFYQRVKSLRLKLQSGLKEMVLFVDIDPLIMEFGFKRWQPTKFLVSSKFCCHPNCFPLYGDYIANYIQSLMYRNAKLVVIDLDNTLWHGVVGDVGWDGVDLNKDSYGYPHLMLQRYLLSLKQSGVLLAICSKNSLESVKKVFENRREMILKLDDFVAQEVNWLPKSENIRKILRDLNLTTTGVVFLDDSRFEREEVRCGIPELTVPELPENSEEWCAFLSRSGYFTIGKVQQDDLSKSDKYIAEKLRQAAATEYSDYSEFLGNLKLQVAPKVVCANNFDRVFELIHKTNQFNLTTNRISRADLLRLSENPDCFCYCYSLADKYSDYGVISVFIAEKQSNAWLINTWLMSCRAMGRGVEYAVFDHFVSTQLKVGDKVCGRYVPTEKNAPISDLLDKVGFDKVSGEDIYSFVIGKNTNTKVKYIEITSVLE